MISVVSVLVSKQHSPSTEHEQGKSKQEDRICKYAKGPAFSIFTLGVLHISKQAKAKNSSEAKQASMQFLSRHWSLDFGTG